MVYFLKYLLKLLKVVAAWLENNACIQVYNSVWSILELLFNKKLRDNENLLTQFLLSELTVCLNLACLATRSATNNIDFVVWSDLGATLC